MQHHNPAFQNLKVLSTDEKKDFDVYLKHVRRDDLKEKQIDSLITNLANASLPKLYKFQTNAPEFALFFEKHAAKANTIFAARLAKIGGYIPEPLIAPDKSYTLPLFNQLMGAYVANEMRKQNNTVEQYKFADKAADYGIYSAIQTVINYHINAIKNATTANMNLDELNHLLDEKVKQIIVQAKRLGGLYWSMGNLDAAVLLLKAADCVYQSNDRMLIEQKNLMEQPLDNNILTIKLVKEAIRQAMFSQALENQETSQRILAVISPAGLFHAYAETFDDFEKAQAYLTRCCKGFMIPNTEKWIQAVAAEVTGEINKLHVNESKPSTPSLSSS